MMICASLLDTDVGPILFCKAWYSQCKFIRFKICLLFSTTYKERGGPGLWKWLLYCMTVLFCRGRLESYEQSCAVDSVTKQCAGLPADCRMAMLGILGTALRSNCACKGTDFTQLYDCMGWQRILWFNPCVGKSTLSSTHYCSKDFLIQHFFSQLV